MTLHEILAGLEADALATENERNQIVAAISESYDGQLKAIASRINAIRAVIGEPTEQAMKQAAE